MSTFIIPMPPTPDARLHLGHAAGPYVSADLTARAMRLSGKACHFLSGIDSYENWVSSASIAQLETTRDANQEDLAAIGVVFDAFKCPSSPAENAAYERALSAVYSQLKAADALRVRRESILYDTKSGTDGFGVEVGGICPNCKAAVQGNACISCFGYWQPWQLEKLHLTRPDAEAKYKQVENTFVSLVDMCDAELAAVSLTDEAQRIFRQWQEGSEAVLRMTYQSDYGVRDSDDAKRVLRNTFFQYCVYLIQSVEAFPCLKPHEIHAFMGLDNFIPSAGGALELAKHVAGARFVRFTLNHMLHYNGSKFSKSKHHGPTIRAMRDKLTPSELGALRVYLASLDLEAGTGNFEDKAFETFCARYLAQLKHNFFEVPLAIEPAANADLQAFIQGDITRPQLVQRFLAMLAISQPEDRRALAGLFSVIDPINFEIRPAATSHSQAHISPNRQLEKSVR